MDLPKITLRDFVEDGSITQLNADRAVEYFLQQVITIGYSNECGLPRQLEVQLPPTMQLPRGGAQGFSTLTKAIDFMIKGLRQGQLFEKMERRETFLSDVSAHLLEVAQAEGIQVEQIRRA